MRSQIALEFLVVIGLSIAILSLVLLIFYPSFQESFLSIQIERVRNLAEKIERLSNSLCSLGENTTMEIYFNIPELTRNFSFINKRYVCLSSIYRGELQIFCRESRCNMTGTLPIESGEYRGFLIATREGVLLKLINPISFIQIKANKTEGISPNEAISYNISVFDPNWTKITQPIQLRITFYGCSGRCVGEEKLVTISNGEYTDTYTYDCSLGNYTILSVEEESQKVFGALLLEAVC
ncbi:MAG: hypothetical protein QW507_03525 [Candidatus Nanoarchaeia archaeon]|nr:hypothetical protein [Candidatus Haiyanarchaeum thermophilum]MCW1303463.1 hypothetical protein [Candidatus Haiyanarchaeum thermophilum]MCW1306914.1 hypothetical protein [Candidatus Haiyanarchaeum thermophilum]MCW1307532.1 hypothetical protein [Candidatus Haiyanarchaeum thermophilum]MCW1308144.1 hypothetical protein [Candidatus Haiyanarchaeum thermophilum]